MTAWISEVTLKILTLLSLPGVGLQTVKKILQYPHIHQSQDLADLGFLDLRLYRAMQDASAMKTANDKVQDIQRQAETLKMHVVSLADPHYPEVLKNTPDAPPVLYLKGHWYDDQSLMTVVGTRTPTRHGEITTERIVQHFTEAGFGVVSGLFPGCSQRALQTALQRGAYVIAVYGTGFDQEFSPALHKLGQQVLEQGLWVSPFPPGTVFKSHQLVQQNRLQVAFGAGLLMVQSGIHGTSLHSVRAALRYGRPVAVPALSQTDQQDGREEAVGVNRLLFSQHPEASTLLDIPPEDLSKIILLHGKQDYAHFEASMRGKTTAPEHLV